MHGICMEVDCAGRKELDTLTQHSPNTLRLLHPSGYKIIGETHPSGTQIGSCGSIAAGVRPM